MDSTRVVVLAAGQGKRMNSDLPKVLLPLGGEPLIKHLLTGVEQSQLTKPAVVVVGYRAELVQQTLGANHHYVLQKEQLGTGHAVLVAESALRGQAEHIMVLYGDHPLVDATTINRLIQAHLEGESVLTMGTIKIPDFEKWRQIFLSYGRIVRDERGEISQIVEYKDATKEQQGITEVNPSYLCFDSEWLWENLKKISNTNAQKEYYLTDLPALARAQGKRIASVEVKPESGLGANTPEQLRSLEEFLLPNGVVGNRGGGT